MAEQMMMDRQDAPIWNAIEASNYKQALKLVDKRLAKKPTDYLEVCPGCVYFVCTLHSRSWFENSASREMP
jgi:hypothetical protein